MVISFIAKAGPGRFHYDGEASTARRGRISLRGRTFVVGEYVSINERRQDAYLPRDASVDRTLWLSLTGRSNTAETN